MGKLADIQIRTWFSNGKTVILLVLAEYIAFILLFIDYSLITLAQFLSSLTGRCFFSLHGLHFGALVP